MSDASRAFEWLGFIWCDFLRVPRFSKGKPNMLASALCLSSACLCILATCISSATARSSLILLSSCRWPMPQRGAFPERHLHMPKGCELRVLKVQQQPCLGRAVCGAKGGKVSQLLNGQKCLHCRSFSVLQLILYVGVRQSVNQLVPQTVCSVLLTNQEGAAPPKKARPTAHGLRFDCTSSAHSREEWMKALGA